jgi:predicted transcriptional regulator
VWRRPPKAAGGAAGSLSPTMRRDPIRGELQERVMRVIWKIGSGSVDDVRAALPKAQRGAYTTVQTILNRLAERKLLTREKQGKAFVYRPRVSEADYLSTSLNRTLQAASQEARLTALASLVGGLDDAEMSEINSLAQEIAAKRRGS